MNEKKLELLVQILKTMNEIQEIREKKEGENPPQSQPANSVPAVLDITHS